jgi:hypothetical protein
MTKSNIELAGCRRISDTLRTQIHDAVHRNSGNPGTLFHDIVDIIEAPFIGCESPEPPQSELMKALVTLAAKAVGQVNYWRNKQAEYPSLEDYIDEHGMLHLPEDIGPLLSGSSANGRYGEATWWLGAIREAAKDVYLNQTSLRPQADLKEFARAMIACSFEGGDAHGGFIQEKALDFGLLDETVFDEALHKDPYGGARNGDPWYVYTDALSDFGATALAASGDDATALVDGIRKALPAMGKSGFELGNSTWSYEPREGAGESLVFRPATAGMIPFSTPLPVCRAPKQMDAGAFETMARYITAVSPAAVQALLKSHDNLAWQLERMTRDRDISYALGKENRAKAAAEADRADLAETHLYSAPSEIAVVNRLVWTSDPDKAGCYRTESIFSGAYRITAVEGDGGQRWMVTLPCGDTDEELHSLEEAMTAAQTDYERRIYPALGLAALPADWQLVPKQAYPEAVGAWWRYKNGSHYPDEPEPEDTSDYGAYAAMLAAMPRYPWPGAKKLEDLSVIGVDSALSRIATENPMLASEAIHDAWRTLSERHAWHVTFPRADQLEGFAQALLEAFEAASARNAMGSADMEFHLER